MELGKTIKALRTERAMTQETLAEMLGVSPQAVSKWENDVTMPDIGLLPALSVAFGVAIDDLFALSDDEHLNRIGAMLINTRDLPESGFAATESQLNAIVARKPDSARAHLLLAKLYEHRIGTYTRQAVQWAQQAIRIAPEEKAGHSVLTNVLHGYGGDWTCNNTLEMVRYYRALLRRVPEYEEGWRWLLDQLIGNGLLDEAQTIIDSTPTVGRHVCAKMWRGDIAYARGDGAEALRLWQECIDEAPDSWRPHAWRADRMVRMGRWDDAIADYEAWLRLQPPPAYTDPFICMALLWEEKGDVDRAIELRQAQLAFLRETYNCEQGEGVDAVLREIARLQAAK